MTVKDAYDVLRKKYNLPSFNDLSDEFEICDIEDEAHVLRSVRHRIQDRLDFASEIIETICHPDPNSVRAMTECSFFNDKDKHSAMLLSQRLMALWRSTTEAELVNEEKTDAELIKLVMKEWPKLKEGLVPFVRKMKDHWQVSQVQTQDLGYLG
ncbi:hypothetical protein HY493_01875 [Candidatus Woesearchaeota archaeon]|nr:hypothetical protein [Candidatus Woesearchaeota archaeon]